MSDMGSEPVVVEPPRRHRWLRRELWFVVGAVVLIGAVTIVNRHHSSVHVAPGAPLGGVPVGVSPVAKPTPG